MEQIAVKAVSVNEGKFLILEQHVEGKTRYSLPGGRVQTNDFKNELKREIREETGFEIRIEKYTGE